MVLVEEEGRVFARPPHQLFWPPRVELQEMGHVIDFAAHGHPRVLLCTVLPGAKTVCRGELSGCGYVYVSECMGRGGGGGGIG